MGQARDSQAIDPICGGSWKAAGDKKKRHENMHITGRCVGEVVPLTLLPGSIIM